MALATGTLPPAPIIPIVTRSGGRIVAPTGPLRISIRRGRVATATLSCGSMFRSQRSVQNGGIVFPTIPLGQCSVLLEGADIAYEPIFPGDRLSCWEDRGTTHCTGGIAASYAARVTVTADAPGALYIDGEFLGALPVENSPVRVGRRLVVVDFQHGPIANWTLTVSPDEQIEMRFPSEPVEVEPLAISLRATNDTDTDPSDSNSPPQ